MSCQQPVRQNVADLFSLPSRLLVEMERRTYLKAEVVNIYRVPGACLAEPEGERDE